MGERKDDGGSDKPTLRDEDIITEDMKGRRSFLRRIGALLVGAAAIASITAMPHKARAMDTDQGDTDSSDSDDEDPEGDTAKGDHKSDPKADRQDHHMADPKLGDYTNATGGDGFDYDENQMVYGDGSRADSD